MRYSLAVCPHLKRQVLRNICKDFFSVLALELGCYFLLIGACGCKPHLADRLCKEGGDALGIKNERIMIYRHTFDLRTRRLCGKHERLVTISDFDDAGNSPLHLFLRLCRKLAQFFLRIKTIFFEDIAAYVNPPIANS